MVKSPGKSIHDMLLGKKSPKSNISKVATLDKETSITINTQSKDLDADPMVISSPVRPVINTSREQTQLDKSTPENERSTMGLDVANDDELIKLEQAATKAETAFRGCLALDQGLGGVVLKSEDVEAVLELKGYFDRRNEEGSLLELAKATITGVQMTGMGDRVCVDLCSLMRPGEGLLVGCFARGLFLVHSECLESNYIASRPFRVNAGPVHGYVAIPGGKTCYLSELKAGKEVVVVDQSGIQRTAVVGRVKIETRPLIIVHAKIDSEKETCYSILLQNAETVGLIPPTKGVGNEATAIPVTSLKVGDQVLLRLQGGARHTGIEIQEFIVEK